MKSRKRKSTKHNKSKKNSFGKNSRKRQKISKRVKPRRIRQRSTIALNPREAALQRRVFLALRRMREGDSLAKATREASVKRGTFIRYARPALRRNGPGKPWKAIPEDKLKSVMNVLTEFGPVAEIISNSRERKLLGRYNRARRMLRADDTGAEAELLKLKGKTVAGHVLITDVQKLIELEEAGILDFDDLYASLGEES